MPFSYRYLLLFIFNDCYKNKCLLSRSDSCVDGDWICRYEQAAIEGE